MGGAQKQHMGRSESEVKMAETKNYKLKKPEGNEYANIEDINNNMDKIDDALDGKVDKKAGKGLSTNDYNNTDKNKVANLPSDTNTELAKKGNAALITETNTSVPVSAWTSDTTYTDFPFRAGIPITGCTANHKPDVTFSLTDAVSGNYAPIAESYAGGIYIYAAEKPTAALTIPTISLLQEVNA